MRLPSPLKSTPPKHLRTSRARTLTNNAVDISDNFISAKVAALVKMSLLSTTRIETAVLSSQDFSAFTPSTFDASFTSLAHLASEIPERGPGPGSSACCLREMGGGL